MALGTAAVSYIALADAILVPTLVNIVDRIEDALDLVGRAQDGVSSTAAVL